MFYTIRRQSGEKDNQFQQEGNAMNRKNQGFTLIELVMVIVILAILAVVALPKFQDLTTRANASAEAGVVGGVRAGIATLHAKNRADNNTAGPNSSATFYPPDLDAIVAPFPKTCGAVITDICFDRVLSQGGVTSQWIKTGALTYTGPVGTPTYTYAPADGSFK